MILLVGRLLIVLKTKNIVPSKSAYFSFSFTHSLCAGHSLIMLITQDVCIFSSKRTEVLEKKKEKKNTRQYFFFLKIQNDIASQFQS